MLEKDKTAVIRENKDVLKLKENCEEDMKTLRNTLTKSQAELQVAKENAKEDAKKSEEAEVLRLKNLSLRERLEQAGQWHEVAERKLRDVHDLRGNLQNSQARCSAQETKISTYQEHFQALQTKTVDIEAIERALLETRQELQACKDDLSRLQPAVQVPDSVVLQDFDTVCRKVVAWVDEEIDTWESAHPETESGHLFSVGDNRCAAEYMSKYPDAGEYLAHYFINRILKQKLWGPHVRLLGLSDEAHCFVQHIEKAMTNGKHPKNAEAIRSWRSETFKAHAMSDNFEAAVDLQLPNITGDMFQELAIIFPILFRNGPSRLRFTQQVVGSAIQLAMRIQSSTIGYKFSMVRNPFCKYKPLLKGDLKTMIVVDAATGKTLKPDAALWADANGMIGHIVVATAPGMYRSDSRGIEIVLRQSAYLANLERPLPKPGQK